MGVVACRTVAPREVVDAVGVELLDHAVIVPAAEERVSPAPRREVSGQRHKRRTDHADVVAASPLDPGVDQTARTISAHW